MSLFLGPCDFLTAEEYLEEGYAANGSPFAPESGEVVIQSSLELINRLK